MATPSFVWLFTAALSKKSAIAHAGEGQVSQRDRGLPDNAISALSKLLGDGVALVNDEVLVEDLKHLAALEIGHLGDLIFVSW